MNLGGEFASRRHDQANRSFQRFKWPLILDVTEHGKKERYSLSRSSFGYADDIPSRHNGRYRLRLDWTRSIIAELFDDFQTGGIENQDQPFV